MGETNEIPEPVKPKPAATIILMCDGGEGLEVLMLKKAQGQHFAAGAMVFPGGKLDPKDVAFVEANGDKEDAHAALKVAAIREMYEECGILLARVAGSKRVMPSAEAAEIRSSNADGAILDLAASAPFELATDRLVRFAHWITPANRPKRFDTHFFIAPAPDAQTKPDVDGYEIVEANWRRPQDVLDDVHGGKLTLVLPTMMNIIKLSKSESVDEALATYRNEDVFCVEPKRIETDEGWQLVIPAEAGYGVTTVPQEFLRSS
jgi:8-oxo-dGTP pyrophosphatase MutT (NUDIX family)